MSDLRDFLHQLLPFPTLLLGSPEPPIDPQKLRQFSEKTWNGQYSEPLDYLPTPTYQQKDFNELLQKVEKKKNEGIKPCVQGSLRVGEFIRCVERLPVNEKLREFEEVELPLAVVFLNEGVNGCMRGGGTFEECIEKGKGEYESTMSYLKKTLEYS